MINIAKLPPINRNLNISNSVSTEFVVINLNCLEDIIKVSQVIDQGKIAIVIINQLDDQTTTRVIDWLNGYIFAVDGIGIWLGQKSFLFGPAHIQITGSSIQSSSQFTRELSFEGSTNIKQIFIKLSEQNLLGMVYIPEGSFQMGSPTQDLEASPEETPVHSVTVKSFYLSQYPITQAQWRVVASFPAVKKHLEPNPSYFHGDNLPVEQISWDDALEFCDRLSQQTGRRYRLPSEAEWEYACRAGSQTKYWFGQNINSDLANYDANSGYSTTKTRLFLRKTTPVDHFKIKNPFGLGDLHGNVWEWCSDHWHANYLDAPSDGTPWLSETNNEQFRVIRGGSWYDLPRFCRCASRYCLPPGRKLNNVGFRIACDLV